MNENDPKARDPGAKPGSADRESEDALAMSDDELRHHAAARLAEHLDLGSDFLQRCEQLAGLNKGDRLGPIYAAARMMGANARAGLAFAQVAQVERRSRTIVERVQPPVANFTDSNSSLENSLQRGLYLTMLRYMKLVADETLVPAINEASENDADTPEKESAAPALGGGCDPA